MDAAERDGVADGTERTARARVEALAEDMLFLDDWEDRYRYVIELGRALPPYPEDARDDAHKVRGCASQVWLSVRPDPAADASRPGDPVLRVAGDSDAHIVRGLVALVLALQDGRRASMVAAEEPMALFERLGLATHLSAQRANGLRSLVDRLRADARAAVVPS